MRLLHACPPSCKRLRVDDAESIRAQQRQRVLELVDEMVEGAASSGPTAPPESGSGTSTTAPSPSPTSRPGSPSTSSSITTGGRTGRWIAKRRTSTLSESRMLPDPAGPNSEWS